MLPGSAPGPAPTVTFVGRGHSLQTFPAFCPCAARTSTCMCSAHATDQTRSAQGKAHGNSHPGRPLPARTHCTSKGYCKHFLLQRASLTAPPPQGEPPSNSSHTHVQAFAHSSCGFLQACLLQFSRKPPEGKNRGPLSPPLPRGASPWA